MVWNCPIPISRIREREGPPALCSARARQSKKATPPDKKQKGGRPPRMLERAHAPHAPMRAPNSTRVKADRPRRRRRPGHRSSKGRTHGGQSGRASSPRVLKGGRPIGPPCPTVVFCSCFASRRSRACACALAKKTSAIAGRPLPTSFGSYYGGGRGKKRSLSWALPLHLWCPCSLSLRGLPRPQPSPLPPCPLSLVRALVWLTEVV